MILFNFIYVLWLVIVPIICHTPDEQILTHEPNKLTGCIIIFQPHYDPTSPQQATEMNNRIRNIMDSYRKYVERYLENTIKFEYSTLFYGMAIEFNNLDRIRELIVQNLRVGENELDIDNYELMDLEIKKLFQNYRRDELSRYGIDLVYQSDTPVSIDEPMM
mmetsp:Transcript_8634/g.10772  ORF Transcript_8634/g.10772 Transcript_8634/m.10772 type:complete len:162 (+) Transcript_8634:65-550(+)